MSRQVTRRKRTTRETTWDLSGPVADAVEALTAKGLHLPDRPADSAPRLPDDPTEASDGDLMSLFVAMTNWSTYTGSLLAIAEVDESSAESEVKRREALSAASNALSKTVTAAKAKVYEDPEYIAAKGVQDAAYATRKITSALHEQAEKRATVLSRELTRRVGREPTQNRAGRWSA